MLADRVTMEIKRLEQECNFIRDSAIAEKSVAAVGMATTLHSISFLKVDYNPNSATVVNMLIKML
jgi:hypothetical protein